MERPKSIEVVEPYKVILGLLGVALAGLAAGPLWLFLFFPVLFWTLAWLLGWLIYAMVEYA